jgi:hypothetical protein
MIVADVFLRKKKNENQVVKKIGVGTEISRLLMIVEKRIAVGKEMES